jgi:hypothetical protein
MGLHLNLKFSRKTQQCSCSAKREKATNVPEKNFKCREYKGLIIQINMERERAGRRKNR